MPRYRRTYVHTNTHAHTTHHTHARTHLYSMPSERDQRHHALFWNARPPVQAVGSATGRAGLYGLTPVGCLSETSPCRRLRILIPNHTPSTKAQSKPPLLHYPWQVAPDRPPTLKRLGSLEPWSPNLSSESDRLRRLRLQSPICTLQALTQHDPGQPAPVARPVAVSACHSLSRPVDRRRLSSFDQFTTS